MNTITHGCVISTAGFENDFPKSDQSPFYQYLIFFDMAYVNDRHITCTF